MVANNYVDKVFLRNKSAIILEIGLKKKGVFETAFDIDEGIHAGSIVVFQNNMKFNMMNCPGKEFRVFFGEQFELIQGRDDKTLIFKFIDSLKTKEIRDFFALTNEKNPTNIKIKLVSQLSRDNLIVTLRSFEEMIDLKDRLIIDKTTQRSGHISKESRDKFGLPKYGVVSIMKTYIQLIYISDDIYEIGDLLDLRGIKNEINTYKGYTSIKISNRFYSISNSLSPS